MPEHITDPRVAIIIALLFSRIKNATYRLPLIGIPANLAGTLLHELAHFLTALLLNARPSGFSLIPKRNGEGWTLGSVTVTNLRWYNAAPVALAPLVLLYAAYGIGTWSQLYFAGNGIAYDLGLLLCMVVLTENAIPSSVDLEMAISNPLSLFIFGFALFEISTRFIP